MRGSGGEKRQLWWEFSWTSEDQGCSVDLALPGLPGLSLLVGRNEREITGKTGRGESTHKTFASKVQQKLPQWV